MSSILKFITVIQKLLIILCILCFIPTSIFVFLPKHHTFNNNHINMYNTAYQQVYTSYIMDYNINNNCTYQQSILNNNYCFNRINIDNYGINCIGQSYQVNKTGFQFCSGQLGKVIKNYFDNFTIGGFVHSNTSYPIFTISPPFNPPIIKYYHYTPYSTSTCKQLAQQLTQNIQQKYTYQYYLIHTNSSQLLWFSILPILTILIILIILNQVTNKFNLRRYIIMACISVNVGLITLIIKGIIYFSDLQVYQYTIASFSNCFVLQQNSAIIGMAYFDIGFGFVYVFFMGIILLLIVLSMVGQIIAKLLELKYYSSRQKPEQTGIQLSDLKTSLRSRRINNTSSIGSSKIIKLQIQE